MRLGMSQCRHPCQWTSRTSQLLLGSALCFPFHVSVKRILLGKGTRQGSWTYTGLDWSRSLHMNWWIVCLLMKFQFLVKSLQNHILRLQETVWSVAAYIIYPFRALALGRRCWKIQAFYCSFEGITLETYPFCMFLLITSQDISIYFWVSLGSLSSVLLKGDTVIAKLLTSSGTSGFQGMSASYLPPLNCTDLSNTVMGNSPSCLSTSHFMIGSKLLQV